MRILKRAVQPQERAGAEKPPEGQRFPPGAAWEENSGKIEGQAARAAGTEERNEFWACHGKGETRFCNAGGCRR